MEVRRFEATTMKDALAAVKRELGTNAVILSTKELPPNQEKIKLFEVTAASAVSNKQGATSDPSQTFTDNSGVGDLAARVSELNDIMPTKSQMRLIEGAVHDIKTLLIEVLRERSANMGEGNHLFAIKQNLRAAGVDEFILSDLTKHLNSLPPPEDIAKASGGNIDEYYKDQAMRWMMKRIKISPKWNATPGITSVHAFVGTPGAGKTTLMSKIATAIQKKERHKIALITFGSEKLSSSEQTRVYSKILNIRHESISAAHEIKRSVMAMKGIDIILIDTPGQNPNDGQATKQFEIMKGLGLSLDFHLVVSAAEKQSVTEKAIGCFSPLGISSIAITKLDESPAYGEAFSISSKWSIPLSYLTFNSDFSDGIERATRERILERIFNI